MPINLGDDSKGGPAMRMQVGEHDVAIVKVITNKADGSILATKDGDRKILAVLTNDSGEEIMDSLIVEGKGVWKLARVLSSVGYHEQELAGEGVNEYTDFLDKKTAERLLVGRRLRILVRERTWNGQVRSEAEIIGPSLGGDATVSDENRVGVDPGRDDIPF